tara:strand:+ start:712 stop:966 length:255 start_codon:yes stop_codon:yes gene_type:complete
MKDITANQIVLPIPNNRYISIVQNAEGYDYAQSGTRYGDYGKRVEIAILDSNFNIINDAFEYGVKGHLSTEQLAKEIINLIIGD